MCTYKTSLIKLTVIRREDRLFTDLRLHWKGSISWLEPNSPNEFSFDIVPFLWRPCLYKLENSSFEATFFDIQWPIPRTAEYGEYGYREFMQPSCWKVPKNWRANGPTDQRNFLFVLRHNKNILIRLFLFAWVNKITSSPLSSFPSLSTQSQKLRLNVDGRPNRINKIGYILKCTYST